jgi:predicted TIM-barrel fold metal-dependent hydrolase
MILDYETYWNGEKASFGNLGQLVNLFEEVDEEYKAVIFPPSANIHPLNKELFEIIRDFPDNDKFIPCAYINPNLHNSVEELQFAVENYGFKGMKLMPTIHRYNVDSIVTYPVMEKAEELEIPVTIHSSSEGGFPSLISKLAGEFPKVPIIMDHSGYRYYRSEAIEAGKSNDNIYFGLSLVAEPAFINRIAKEVGTDRLIYGSNAAGGIPRIGLMVFEYTELTEKEKKRALGENLRKILGK